MRPTIIKQTNKLAYELFFPKDKQRQDVEKSIVFLHGILGSKKNWRTPAREFLKLRSNYAAAAIDHVGHGESRYKYDETTQYNVSSSSKDLLTLFHSSEFQHRFPSPPNVLCAHSFGGKVALDYLRQSVNEQLPIPQTVWILDSKPGPYDENLMTANLHQTVHHVIQTLSKAPIIFDTKEDAINYLLTNHIAKPIALWLGTSLIPVNLESTQVQFTFDMQIILQLFDDFIQLDYKDFLMDFQGNCQIHFLRAGKNNAWTKEILQDFDEIMSVNSRIQLHTMPNVGHWLHSEDLPGMLRLMLDKSDI